MVIELPSALLGQVLIITPRKTGVDLHPLAFTVGETETVELAAEVLEAPASCKVSDISEQRVNVDQSYAALNALASESLTELLERKQSGAQWVVERIERAQAELSELFKASQTLSSSQLPTARWVCPKSESGCTVKSYGRARRSYRRIVVKSYNAFAGALSDLLEEEVLTQSYVRGKTKEARLLKQLALTRLKRLKLRTSECVG